jgi:hypothetical protein
VLAPADPFINSGFLTMPIRWNQDRERPPYDFFRSIAEDTFRSGVPRGDNAVEILNLYRVIGILHNCRKSLSNFVGTFYRVGSLE